MHDEVLVPAPLPSAASRVHAEAMRAAYAVVGVTDTLSPTCAFATTLQQDVRRYVAARRDDGVFPEQVLIELKAMRTLPHNTKWAFWLRAHDDKLRDRLVHWLVEEYFATPARGNIAMA